MQEQSWQPPKWWYRKNRPSTDDAYFENMSRVILEAGLNWSVIDKKWDTIKAAFENFSVDRVSNFNSNDVERFLLDKGVVRNRNKIEGIIINAVQFKKIRQQYGGFQQYLNSLDKSNNYVNVVKSQLQKVRQVISCLVSLHRCRGR